LIGKAYLGGFSRGYEKGKEDGPARIPAEAPTDDGENVAGDRISQKYTDELKSFADFGKTVEDRTPREERIIGKSMECKAHSQAQPPRKNGIGTRRRR
jgi:hypothetical protein